MTQQAGVLGWGYEGKSVADLVAFAAEHDASIVVDVRLNPVSRKAGFSKRRLSETLGEANIQYLHFRALGNPRDNRSGFADVIGAVGRQARGRFVKEVLTETEAQQALTTVAGLAANGTVILLCYEDEERCCHRSLVIDALADEGAVLATA